MLKNTTIQLRWIPQVTVKFALFVTAVFICANAFELPRFMDSQGIYPSIYTLLEVFALSVLLTGIQILFLTEQIIKSLPFLLRSTLSLVSSDALIIVLGIRFKWFSFEPVPIMIFVLIFSAVFFLSIMILMTMQNKAHMYLGDALHAVRLWALSLLTAFVIGFSAGYRGLNELDRPWELPQTSITEFYNSHPSDNPDENAQ